MEKCTKQKVLQANFAHVHQHLPTFTIATASTTIQSLCFVCLICASSAIIFLSSCCLLLSWRTYIYRPAQYPLCCFMSHVTMNLLSFSFHFSLSLTIIGAWPQISKPMLVMWKSFCKTSQLQLLTAMWLYNVTLYLLQRCLHKPHYTLLLTCLPQPQLIPALLLLQKYPILQVGHFKYFIKALV